MTVPDGDGFGAGDDVLEVGGGRRLVPRWLWLLLGALIVGAAALLAGLAIGYAAGAQHSAEPAAPPSRAVAPAEPFSAGGFPLSQSGPQCSVQAGRELQVGVQIMNLSPAVVRLDRVEVVLPLGGLRVISQAWGPCAQLPLARQAPTSIRPPALGQGASSWFTVTFQVLVRCPQPLPVQFTLDDDQQGQLAAIRLPGFPDLSQVPYAGCP